MESVPLQMVLKFQVVLGLEVRTTVNVLLDMHVRTIVVGVGTVVQETAMVDHGVSVVIV